MARLHDNGLIADPVGKAKRVAFSEEGLHDAERLLHTLFDKTNDCNAGAGERRPLESRQ